MSGQKSAPAAEFDLRSLLEQLVADVREIKARLQTPSTRPATFADMPDTLGYADLARLIGRGERYFERFVTLERKTGVRVLPDPLPGVRGRFSKDAVARWLKHQTWRLADGPHRRSA